MKKIKFIQDYRGVLTKEKYFENGDVTTVSDADAKKLVRDKRAKYEKEGKDG